jgi:hypothetical protein
MVSQALEQPQYRDHCEHKSINDPTVAALRFLGVHHHITNRNAAIRDVATTSNKTNTIKSEPSVGVRTESQTMRSPCPARTLQLCESRRCSDRSARRVWLARCCTRLRCPSDRLCHCLCCERSSVRRAPAVLVGSICRPTSLHTGNTTHCEQHARHCECITNH